MKNRGIIYSIFGGSFALILVLLLISLINTNSYNNNNVTTTRTRVVYNDGVTSTSSVRTLSTYVPNTETQIIYKNTFLKNVSNLTQDVEKA